MKKNFNVLYITPYSEDHLKVEDAVVSAYQKANQLMHDVSIKMTVVSNIVAGTNLTIEVIKQIQNAHAFVGVARGFWSDGSPTNEAPL